MTIPKYHELMLPLLKYASDQKEHSFRSAIKYLTEDLNLKEEEKRELLPSGNQPIFDNRVGWAKTYLVKAKILESTRRGFFRITERGMKVLESDPKQIDKKYLEKFSEFNEFKNKSKDKDNMVNGEESIYESKTPKEVLEESYQKLREDIEQELLSNINDSTPEFFEKIVIDLLIGMGYGGSRKDAGQAIGKVNDGGIDGIIKEDRLGLDVIYIQAKRWEGTVGRPEIQKFAGALEGNRAKKGIFITTSQYSKEAKEYVKNINSKIILIDGDLLTKYMFDFNVGVAKEEIFEIKAIDNDYFINE